MRKLIVGATALALLLGLTLALAPSLRAQGRGRAFSNQFDELIAQGLGSGIGMSVRDLDAEEVSKAKLPQPGGALVSSITDGGPAAKAGLKSGDVVVEFDGERVRSARHLMRLVRETPAGRTVKASIVRDGSRQTLDLTPEARGRVALDALPDIQREVERGLRDMPRNLPFDFDPPDGAINPRGRLGAVLMPVSDQLASYFGVKQGVLVSAVEGGSPAAQGGLKAGDIITAINGHMVGTPADVAERVRDAQAGTGLDMRVMRDRKEVSLKVTLPQRPASRGYGQPV